MMFTEIRAFGRPAKPPVVDPERFAWDQPAATRAMRDPVMGERLLLM